MEPSRGIRAKGSERRYMIGRVPSGMIGAEGSELRDPSGEIRAEGFELRHPSG